VGGAPWVPPLWDYPRTAEPRRHCASSFCTTTQYYCSGAASQKPVSKLANRSRPKPPKPSGAGNIPRNHWSKQARLAVVGMQHANWRLRVRFLRPRRDPRLESCRESATASETSSCEIDRMLAHVSPLGAKPPRQQVLALGSTRGRPRAPACLHDSVRSRGSSWIPLV
jgi:hypothetical protein